ncbi:MAG TPA: hypothetical protein PLS69_15650, partial [Terricaulis sp.]|nr:hypothetical protein [Terricaulis sp.]
MSQNERTAMMIAQHGAEWCELYDAGHGCDSIACIMAARGIVVGNVTVKNGLASLGVVFRNRSQAQRVAKRIARGGAI